MTRIRTNRLRRKGDAIITPINSFQNDTIERTLGDALRLAQHLDHACYVYRAYLDQWSVSARVPKTNERTTVWPSDDQSKAYARFLKDRENYGT
jgi:hypothetical protein